nr:hypothetical protein [Acinetobacter sp. ANC 4470]
MMHWISVYQDDALDTQLITDLVIGSYEMVVNKLNKIQKQRLNLLKSIQ